MINVNSMSEHERMDYIFGDIVGPITNRFGWLQGALLNDIQTLVNTIQLAPQLVRGGGNLSIPIVVCTGLELASSLYVGMTDYLARSKYNNPSKYNATLNVEKFINNFFIGHSQEIPRLIWDGVRNGVDHLFIPKFLKYSQFIIQFTFYVGTESQVIRTNNLIEIRINSVELYTALMQSIDRYKTTLLNKADLQCNFITA